MVDTCNIWLPNPKKTEFCGQSLASSLYGPVDILLKGELGAGKTTFANGFSTGVGIAEHLPSPTFALEHRYSTANNYPFIHIDLYRLNDDQTDEFLEQCEEKEAIRCIEWSEKLSNPPKDAIHITILDNPDNEGRNLEAVFEDMPLPCAEEIEDWRKEMELPERICAHCDAVANFALELSNKLIEKGHIIRSKTLYKAGVLHDLLRFVDFSEANGPKYNKKQHLEPDIWKEVRAKYEGKGHEEACAMFLTEQGYGKLAEIIKVHGLKLPPENRRTIEQKLLYYADKRVINDKVVTLEERFKDFNKRYKDGKWGKSGKIWFDQAKELEEELGIII
ncbi:tRNA (adenosine(37)-N6)-threonylcarbamoyltransferase complex ATPase subunit type 1 TsaE [Candidatus Peregrinibacteria bacterium]|jgi:tRNA threonylcarbamoyladenosine biosynthesis protein TsaE|nr:tRNA (adenosine(37)-N6)-threonylcarbamoyltransferase complex ATPase subunit type 1 TsaE [Candidatus Peregrinibacteria bacterium]MBT3598973.1 tRNA (adenosine(37)-N6)-threonylcarbamoyltransferase complex ATPase subunit type 1 TsaE [Candidatus Peregrinibacteria bacterium]MBT4367631.1 tRNA (adenosine(37)-N6)-threonylcarbamoyltransferase complex ATPase subunit type 1 TsaE [Candidatus Peregrinibacteria bacterium]MBT4585501.1 tRNA (adenosine(37)-N6)-threonylcarbamoyltransferase complex ATPase subuni